MPRILDPDNVFEDDFGDPLSGGTVTLYANRTVTLKATYSDPDLTVQNANPLTLDADGRLPSDIWGTGLYTIRVADVNGATIAGAGRNDVGPATAADLAYLERTVAEKLADFFHVADYGAVGDGTTNDTAAIQDACTAVQNNGGGTLLWDPKTYLIYPTGTLSGSIIMHTFTGCNGIHLDGRGAEIIVGDVFAGTEALCLFQFTSCINTDVGSFTFTSTPEAIGLAVNRGVRPVLFQTTCINIHFHDIIQVGGQFCFSTNRTVSVQDETKKSRNILVERVECTDVGYPLGLENSGDRITVRNFKATRAGRAVAIYGVRDFDIELTLVDPQSSPSCYLTTGITADSNYLERGRISVTSVDTISAGAQANTVAIYMLWDNTEQVAGVVRNIDVELNCKVVAGSADYAVFSIGKVVNGVGADASDRGHIIENVKVSGTITNAVSRVGVVDLMYTYGTWGHLDFIKNLSLDNLSITGSGTTNIKLFLSPIVDYLRFTNVHAPAAPTILGSAQFGIKYENCDMGEMRTDETQYSVQNISGSGAIDTEHEITWLNTTGGGTYTLQDGREGQSKVIVMILDAGDATVTPAHFEGNAASTTLTFDDVGDSCQLKFTNGAWHLIGSYGVVVA